MVCAKCGTEFSVGEFCPECGTRFEIKNQTVETVQSQAGIETQTKSNVDSKGKANGKAIASLVFGLIALFTGGALFIPEILGIIFAFASRKNGKMSGMAIAGLVCSIIACVLLLVILLI